MSPSVADVDAIASVAEPVLRNLRITAAYAELSRAFNGWLPAGANWCTYATWASRQAGCTIRKEDLARAVEERLEQRLSARPLLREVHHALGLSTARLSAMAGDLSQGLPGIDRASAAVARGNLKVFAEIGRVFAQFVASVPTGGMPEVNAFFAGLRTGPPPDGQDLLLQAFTTYVTARTTHDPALRAQQLLLANVQIGLHEQTRLQPEIAEAMDAALLDVADTRRRVIDRLDRLLSDAAPLAPRDGLRKDLLNRVADEIAQELRLVARMVITDRLMTIGLPEGRVLHLGTDLVDSYPARLATITEPQLAALLSAYAAAAATPRGSGALDWSVLAERLHFIASLFRAYQEDPTLLQPPFPAAALAAMANGVLPELT